MIGINVSFWLFAIAAVVALYLIFWLLSLPLRRLDETPEERLQRIRYGS